ncbi:MAG: hypothetical protein FP827_08300 [Candidatus Omnitrophica bacterium]|nr:hypothetical protein [Candidatus Omnitrophota bacterium]
MKIRRQISKNAKISENGKYAVIGTGIGTIDVINNDGTEISFRGEGPSESRLELLDNNGNVLWEKKFVEGRCPNFMDCIIAQNGIVAVIIGKGIEIGEDILHAYNTNGDEILVYPKKIGEAYPGGAGDMRISPNGRYLAVQVGFLYPTASKKVFFDLQSGSLWKADKPYVVYEITNEGQAKVDYYDADKKKLSATETIDFKKYLEE